jgi:hypothetical protein
MMSGRYQHLLRLLASPSFPLFINSSWIHDFIEFYLAKATFLTPGCLRYFFSDSDFLIDLLTVCIPLIFLAQTG